MQADFSHCITYQKMKVEGFTMSKNENAKVISIETINADVSAWNVAIKSTNYDKHVDKLTSIKKDVETLNKSILAQKLETETSASDINEIAKLIYIGMIEAGTKTLQNKQDDKGNVLKEIELVSDKKAITYKQFKAYCKEQNKKFDAIDTLHIAYGLAILNNADSRKDLLAMAKTEKVENVPKNKDNLKSALNQLFSRFGINATNEDVRILRDISSLKLSENEKIWYLHVGKIDKAIAKLLRIRLSGAEIKYSLVPEKEKKQNDKSIEQQKQEVADKAISEQKPRKTSRAKTETKTENK